MARFHKQEQLDLLNLLDGKGWVDTRDIHLKRGDWIRLSTMERSGMVEKKYHKGGLTRSGYIRHRWKITEKGKTILQTITMYGCS